jgi:hypothetical protein
VKFCIVYRHVVTAGHEILILFESLSEMHTLSCMISGGVCVRAAAPALERPSTRQPERQLLAVEFGNSALPCVLLPMKLTFKPFKFRIFRVLWRYWSPAVLANVNHQLADDVHTWRL